MVYALGNQTKLGGKATIDIDVIKGDGDRKAIEVEDSAPDGGLYFGHGRALVSGRRIKTDHVPKQMRALTDGPIPDYAKCYNFSYVSDRFRAVIESIEPGVHQFIPFQIVGARKSVLVDMWFMVVCNRIDSVDREHTTLVLYRGRDWVPHQDIPRSEWPANFNPNREPKFVFNNAQIGTLQLWYDIHSGYGPYLSDRLAEALMAAELTGLVLVKQEAV